MSLKTLRRKFLQTRLIWKLMISYGAVIVIGLTTMALAAESVAPASFERHMMGMRTMMGQIGPGMQQLEADLFTNYRAAITEALLLAAGVALVTAVVVSIFVSRRVVTPIHEMMQASHHIAAGHYHERVNVTGEDELGQLAHSFNQMVSTLEKTETMRRELMANVAHELRTPLSSIKGYMEGLVDGVLPAQAETYQQVYREADRLQRLVNDLQELSRVEARAFDFNRQRVTLSELIRQISARLRPQFEEKGVILNLNLPTVLPPVLADEDRICQVLTNLMGNAPQYTPGGGQVAVAAEVTNGPHQLPNGDTLAGRQVVVTFKDNGLGIAAEHLPHLFTRFYRIDKSRSRAGGGSGIGLTIARHLVEAHGGKIWVKSAGEGNGSEFGFSLPLA
ncbi:MAG: HAMP domain-containing protein [Anaerolineae bacterium]|nr:HAMP domain-containing protein [Anaerolineae bacterium]